MGDAAKALPVPAEKPLPPGARVVRGFVSQEEATQLARDISAHEWSQLAKRRVQHYGYIFDYGTRGAALDQPLGPMPHFLSDWLIPRVALVSKPEAQLAASKDAGTCQGGVFLADQVSINEYDPGVGLRPHVDTHSAFEDIIVSVSLESGVMFQFRNDDDPDDTVAVWLEPRALLIMSGEARYRWRHYLPLRKFDKLFDGTTVARRRRVSITMRKVRNPPSCSCPWPLLCDWQTTPKCPDVESLHVHQVYEAIAPHFDSTRFALWPGVRRFLQSLPESPVIADVGCGNGKYLDPNLLPGSTGLALGSDRSPELVSLASTRTGPSSDVCVSDCLTLPYRSESVDAAISIAVVHHLATDTRRRASILELLRVTRRGGRILVYVWAFEQEDKKRTLDKWTPIENGKPGDYLVPWRVPKNSGGTTGDNWQSRAKRLGGNLDTQINKAGQEPLVHLDRYYHVFAKGELRQLCERVGSCVVEDEWFDRSNWAIVLKKT